MTSLVRSLTAVAEVALAGFCVSAGLMQVAKRAAIKFGITAPRTRGEAPEQVPALGGPPIIAGALLAALLAGATPLWLAVPVMLLCAAGVIDDAIVLTPKQKIGAELLAAVMLVALGPHPNLTGYPLVDLMLATFWLVTAANAFNLIDGLDGLAGGVGLITAVVIGAAAFIHGQNPLALKAFALAGALAGFLAFNISPASIFMGDSGALPIGMLLGFLTLQAGRSSVSEPFTRFLFPLVVMLVPLMDTSIVTISRIATGNSISRHGHDHSHHRLLGLGLSTRRAVATCWGAALLYGLCALALSVLTGIYVLAFLPFVVLSGAVLALFMVDLTFDSVAPASAYAGTKGLARMVLRSAYQWRLGDMLLDAATISAAFFGAYLIRLDFHIPGPLVRRLVSEWWQVVAVSYAALFAAGVYRSIWRYTELSDSVRFMSAAIVAGAMFAALQFTLGGPVSWSVVLLFTILLCNLLTATRISFKVLRRGVAWLARSHRRVLIFGAGRTGDRALEFLLSTPNGVINQVIGFLDDDPFKHGKRIQGRPVLGPIELIDQVYESVSFDEIVLAVDDLPAARERMLRAFVSRRGVTLRNFAMGHGPRLTPADVLATPRQAAVLPAVPMSRI